MALIRRMHVFQTFVRQMSDIAVYEGQPTKFAVLNGKFVRISKKNPEATEEVTHTGQVFQLCFLYLYF